MATAQSFFLSLCALARLHNERIQLCSPPTQTQRLNMRQRSRVSARDAGLCNDLRPRAHPINLASSTSNSLDLRPRAFRPVSSAMQPTHSSSSCSTSTLLCTLMCDDYFWDLRDLSMDDVLQNSLMDALQRIHLHHLDLHLDLQLVTLQISFTDRHDLQLLALQISCASRHGLRLRIIIPGVLLHRHRHANPGEHRLHVFDFPLRLTHAFLLVSGRPIPPSTAT